MLLPKPTDAELGILRVLWRGGPSTVRQVHDVLLATKDLGYTTVLKLMQIMAEKGLLTRDESERSHIYHPAIPQEKTKKQLINDLVDRAFAGSAHHLILQALDVEKVSAGELAEIRQLIDQIEKNQ